MPLAAYLALFGAALVVANILTPQIIRLCQRYEALDQPNERKVHRTALPRLGGVAIFTALSVAMSITAFGVVQGWFELSEQQADLLAAIYLGLTGFFFIGFIDDLKSLPARPRLIAQFAVATMLVVLSGENGIRITAALGRLVFPEWLSIVLTVLWIVVVVNTFNWIDGLDGLAGGVAAISALAFFTIGMLHPTLPNATLGAAICVAIIGAICGYLPYNFHPARIIMGDGGAFSLGYLLAVVSILGLFKQAALISFIVPVAVLALPIGDTVYAILRRLFRGIPITTPDKRHIHHRVLALLSRRYRSKLPAETINEVEEQLVEHRAHRNTVLALYAFTTLCAAVAVGLSLQDLS